MKNYDVPACGVSAVQELVAAPLSASTVTVYAVYGTQSVIVYVLLCVVLLPVSGVSSACHNTSPDHDTANSTHGPGLAHVTCSSDPTMLHVVARSGIFSAEVINIKCVWNTELALIYTYKNE